MTTGVISCMGKLPIHGDFVRLNHVQVPEIAEFDRWLLGGIERGYERNGRAYEQELRSFAPLRFLYVSPRTQRLLHGFLLPSADQVGRTYPLTVGYQLVQPAPGTEFDRSPLVATATMQQVLDLVHSAAGKSLPDWLQALQSIPFAAENGTAEQAMRTYLLGTSLDSLWGDWPGFHSPERRQQLMQELWQATQPPFPPRYVITVPSRGQAGETAFWLSLVRQWLAIRVNPVLVAWPAVPGPGLVRWLYDELHGRYFETVLWPDQANSLALQLGRNTMPRRDQPPHALDFVRLLRPRALLQDVLLGANRG